MQRESNNIRLRNHDTPNRVREGQATYQPTIQPELHRRMVTPPIHRTQNTDANRPSASCSVCQVSTSHSPVSEPEADVHPPNPSLPPPMLFYTVSSPYSAGSEDQSSIS